MLKIIEQYIKENNNRKDLIEINRMINKRLYEINLDEMGLKNTAFLQSRFGKNPKKQVKKQCSQTIIFQKDLGK